MTITTSTAEALLDQAAAVLTRGETSKTTAYLECGRLLQEVLELRVGRDGEKRSRVLACAHARLRQATGCCPDPHGLLHCFHVYRLLGNGIDPAEHRLAYGGLKALMRLVRRTGQDGSQCNEWQVHPAVDPAEAKALFQRWASSCPRLSPEELKAEVDVLFGQQRPRLTPQESHVPQRRKLKPPDRELPRNLLETACPVDAAGLAEFIRRADDVEGLLFDAVAQLDWKPSYSEAIAAGLAEAGMLSSLAALRRACDLELGRLGKRKTA